MNYPWEPAPCGMAVWFSFDAIWVPGASKGAQCHHVLARWDLGRCGAAGLQGSAAVRHVGVILMLLRAPVEL